MSRLSVLATALVVALSAVLLLGQTAQAQTAPEKPKDFTVDLGDNDGEVDFEWIGPREGVTKWQYRQKTTGAYGAWQDISNPATRIQAATTYFYTHTVSGLMNYTEYTFQVRGVNAAGNGVPSVAGSQLLGPDPVKPTGFTAVAGPGQVKLSWDDPSNPSILGTQYRQKTTGGYGNWRWAYPRTATTTSYTITGLTPGTEYTFQIRTLSRKGAYSPKSNKASATPTAVLDPGGVTEVTEVTAVWNSAQLEVRWPAVSGAEGYRIRWRRTDVYQSWQVMKFGPEPQSYVFRNQLAWGTKYELEMYAIVDGAWKAMGERFEVAPAAVRGKVRGFATDTNVLKVRWDKPASYYRSYQRGYQVRWCPEYWVNMDGSCKEDWSDDENDRRDHHPDRQPPRRVNGWGAADVNPDKTAFQIGSNYKGQRIGNTYRSVTGQPIKRTAYVVQVWGLPTYIYQSPFLIGETVVRTLGDCAKFSCISHNVLNSQQDPGLGAVLGPEDLTAHVAAAPAEHTGKAAFAVRIAFSAPLAKGASEALRNGALVVDGGAVKDVRRVDRGRDLREIRVRPDGPGAVTLRLAATSDCAADGALCTGDGQALSGGLSHTVPGPVALSVADARAREGVDDTIDFAVTLSRAASGEVTVRYATRDGTAKVGEDFKRAKGKLVFAAGETEKTVSVEVLDDAHDEDEETFALVLRKASGAVIADGEAVGTIENDDPMPQAWIARFGRTVASQAVDAVTARLEAGGGGSHVTLGGQQLSLDTPQGRAEAKADVDAVARALGAGPDAADGAEPGAAWDGDGWMRGEGRAASSRSMTGRELLLGSSFHLSAGGGAAGGPGFAAWGRVAHGSFDADVDGVRLDGAVTTGFVGADVASGRWLGGAAVSVSEGEGTFGLSGDAAAESAFGSGTVESTLTSILPYARYALSERVSVWGLAGWGTGTLTLTLTAKGAEGAEEEKRYRTDLSMTLGAVGARGALLTPEEADGFALALKGDAFFVRTESDAVRSGAGNLAAAQGDASRLRLALDASRAFDMGGGATLTPSLELGVRHDGGDAETGFGADIGGGLAYSGHGLTAALHGRGLMSHEAGGMRERGFSGSLAWDPRPDTDRGMSLSLTQTVGASASGGADALLGRETLAGLAANDNGADARRLELKLGYGFSAFGDRFTSTPELGVGLSNTGRDYRLGWRLTSALEGDPGFEVGLDATRRETANGNGPPEHGVMLRGAIKW